jgi:hypothetical protein
MRRSDVLHRLVKSEQQIALGHREVARQREIVDQLEGNGSDTTMAEAALAKTETILALDIAERDRLQSEYWFAPE